MWVSLRPKVNQRDHGQDRSARVCRAAATGTICPAKTQLLGPAVHNSLRVSVANSETNWSCVENSGLSSATAGALWVPTNPVSAHGDLTSLAPQEGLSVILVVPREKSPTGAAARPLPLLRGLLQ